MKEIIVKILKTQLNLNEAEIASLIEVPKDTNLGDYTFPCFALAKTLKKNPVEIAKNIASSIKHLAEFEKIEAVGPYVNFFVDRQTLALETLKTIMKEKNKYGTYKSKKEHVMIEFSQANTHKAFHIGHVRGTSLGESLARISAFVGNKVTRANYQGDTGIHVAKWLWCYLNYHKKEILKKDEEWISSIYVESVKRLAENPEYEKEVAEINKKLEDRSDKNLFDLWKKTRKLCLNAFESIYSDLSTNFDHYFFESEVEKRGKEISQELIKRNIAEISEGATIVRLDKYNLGVWVLLRKDGTVLYSAKDLALAEDKFNKFKVDRSVYVVGAAQRHHFMQLFKTLELMQFRQAGKCAYIPVTEVRLPWGKMSSRTGENVLYSEFKKEIVAHALQEIRKRASDISQKDLEKRALAISIAALKYDMLKQDVNKSLVFNKDEALRFEGDTGPYLLYSYARAKSILAKAKIKKPSINAKAPIAESEKRLLSLLASFPKAVREAYEDYAPNHIANYAYQLAQTFNEFYHQNQVIGSENEQFRLALVSAFAQVLKNALHLLGISPIEKM